MSTAAELEEGALEAFDRIISDLERHGLAFVIPEQRWVSTSELYDKYRGKTKAVRRSNHFRRAVRRDIVKRWKQHANRTPFNAAQRARKRKLRA